MTARLRADGKKSKKGPKRKPKVRPRKQPPTGFDQTKPLVEPCEKSFAECRA
jgi:hypothetical protein